MKISNDFVDGKRNIFDIGAVIFPRQNGYIYIYIFCNNKTLRRVIWLQYSSDK